MTTVLAEPFSKSGNQFSDKNCDESNKQEWLRESPGEVNLGQPIVVFDLDGTLAHTAPDLLDSLNYALKQFGYCSVQDNCVEILVGQGAKAMIERALIAQNIQPTDTIIDNLLPVFLNFYHDTMPGKTRYFDGVDAVLDDLLAQGFLIAVCTNKSQASASRLLSFLEPKPRFSALCGGDKFEWRKPDPRHITATIAQAGGDVRRAIMVGDSFADIEAAKRVPIPVIGVDFGYSDVPIGELGADYVASDFAAIGTLCRQIL